MKNIFLPLRNVVDKMQLMWNRVPKFLRVTIKVGSTISLLLTLSGTGYIAYLIDDAKKTTPDGLTLYEGLKKRAGDPTFIRDHRGEILAAISDKNEFDVPLEQMNPYLVACLISVEDERIFDHNGFDTQAIFGMIRDNVLRGKTRGMSTLGSQLFKEDSPEKEGKLQYIHDRGKQKIRERVQAQKLFDLGVEAKWFGLEYYLNNTYFVTNEKGIAAAARIIFGKDHKDLTIDECALIVGLAQNPAEINPLSELVSRRQAAERRTDKVLGNLLRNSNEGVFGDEFRDKFPEFAVSERVILAAIAEQTITKTVHTPTKKPTSQNYIPFSTSAILRNAQQELLRAISYQEDEERIANLRPGDGLYMGIIRRNERGGLDTLRVRDGGFNITTSIDLRLQKLFTDVLKTGLQQLDKKWPHPDYPLNGAILCVENATGRIVADVRGRDFSVSQFDFRHARTEQGSVMKAAVIAAALELQVIASLQETYRDTAITLTHEQYPGITASQGWTPGNFSGYTNSDVSIGDAALVNSRNNSIVYVFQQAALQGKGQQLLDRIYEILDAMDVGRYDQIAGGKENPQIGLGLLPADLDFVASMYMALANGGALPSEFTDVLSIQDNQGGLLYEAPQMPQKAIYSPEVCRDLLPYLQQKGEKVTGKDNIIAKSGTTGGANKVWMVLASPTHTLVMRVGPNEYIPPGSKTVLGWGDNVDATGLLTPMIRQLLGGMEKNGFYDATTPFDWYYENVLQENVMLQDSTHY